MLTILIDDRLESAADGLQPQLQRAGVDAVLWSTDGPSIVPGVDALLTSAEGLASAQAAVSLPPSVRVIVLAVSPEPDDTRVLLRRGAHSVLDAVGVRATRDSAPLVAAAMGQGVVPAEQARTLASCLEKPPRNLTDIERRMLVLAATSTIEEAGLELGYSRRQTQRRVGKLRDELGLEDHRDLIIAAARWGLLEAEVSQGARG